ncbi:MAG: glycoside hydrolase family 3 protein [Phocaeicola sp.]
MKKKLSFLLLSLVAMIGCASNSDTLSNDETLRKEIAQMLLVGFQGAEVTPQSPIYRYVKEVGVGGVLLFDIDLCGTKQVGSRNIRSKEQVTQLIKDLQQISSTPLLVAIDQEGGRVSRLKEAYGFPATVSAAYLGKIDKADTTSYWASATARELEAIGVNLNFAPVVDLNVNPQSPVIGKIERSFSNQVDVVVKNGGIWVDEHRTKGILTSLKHFPGHGSATVDSHHGFTDITDSWSEVELEPFQQLIAADKADIVMTAHVFNKHLDEKYPATLSPKVLQNILREELGFDGVISTDDLYMDAIAQHYTLEEALTHCINAGANLLCMGNNSPEGYVENRPQEVVDTILKLVKEGKIAYSKITDSTKRIAKLKAKLGVLE